MTYSLHGSAFIALFYTRIIREKTQSINKVDTVFYMVRQCMFD